MARFDGAAFQKSSRTTLADITAVAKTSAVTVAIDGLTFGATSILLGNAKHHALERAVASKFEVDAVEHRVLCAKIADQGREIAAMKRQLEDMRRRLDEKPSGNMTTP